MTVALRRQSTPVVAPGFDDAVAAVSVPRPRGAPRVPLGPLEHLVMRRIDGRRSLADIAALLELSSREVLALVFRLEELGVAELGHASGRYAILDADDLEDDDA